MNEDITNYRVSKKLSPTARGAKRLHRIYGEQLVCVRHRIDPSNQTRVTTVELVVERAPIQPKAEREVAVELGFNERALRAVVLAAGAQWDVEAKLWRMPERVAKALNLQERIVGR
jgi:hypothetical protein